MTVEIVVPLLPVFFACFVRSVFLSFFGVFCLAFSFLFLVFFDMFSLSFFGFKFGSIFERFLFDF